MIPVQLRLHNFLSYGEAPPVLDFEQFNVACLSGKNGQGKSALLDAITWALWGEGRKSSNNRKPDDDLIRIGTQHMEVEFVFDLESIRYRVTRTYTKSASGKTTRPGLEFQALEGEDDYRALTGANLTETQALIDRVLGIDYQTFINSAFLLQGRSDEFTKKRPNERKEILTSILNLERYERLSERALERIREANQRIQQAEVEMERLEAAVADASLWKEDLAAVEIEAADAKAALDTVREEETQLAQEAAQLQAREEEAERLRKKLVDLKARQAEEDEQLTALAGRIEQATQLIGQADAIQRSHERHVALTDEREALDEKRNLYDGLARQLQQRRQEIKDRRASHEKRLHELRVQLRSDKEQLARMTAALAELPSAKRSLDTARTAQAEYKALKAKQEKRQTLTEQIQQVEQQLHDLHQGLVHQLKTTTERRTEAETVAADAGRIDAELKACRQRIHARDEAKQAIEALKAEGHRLKEAHSARLGEYNARKAGYAERAEELHAIQAVEAEVCPTCGTDLTPAHREQVERKYRRQLDALAGDLEQDEAWLRAKKEQIRALADRVNAKQEVLDEQDDPAHAHTRLQDQRKRVQEAAQQVQALCEHEKALRKQLDERSFGTEQRQQLAALKQRREAIAFDAERLEVVQAEALRLNDYEKKVQQLLEEEGRHEQLVQTADQRTAQEARLRRELDDGSVDGDLPALIERLERQQQQIGFDGARFETVKQHLRQLKDAPMQLQRLAHAQQNLADWRAQREAAEQRLRQHRDEQAEARQRLDEVAGTEAARAALRRQKETVAGRRMAAEGRLQQLQQRRGELSTKLKQAAEDRKALRAVRAGWRAAEGDKTLYEHVRKAFGKNGIPSLIIEQTLPEIESRANDLLERLTDGKMHVRLDTLREKKTGGTKETLEIIITDEQGTPRPYETFSGGEAFRANFALRIALAQLLAERSGVRVRTLVIDEGFGTQDPQGVQSMVEAIHAIQDDFDKILVITHLDELKEAFPVRIEVAKDPVEGSSFQILGA